MALHLGDRVRCIHLPYTPDDPEYPHAILQPHQVYEVIDLCEDTDPEETMVDVQCLLTRRVTRGWFAYRFQVVEQDFVVDLQESDPWLSR